MTHLDKLGLNTQKTSEDALSGNVVNRDPFVVRGSVVSCVWAASPGENPPAVLPLLHPAHPRAADVPQEPLHLLINIKYAVGRAHMLSHKQVQECSDIDFLHAVFTDKV